MHKQLNFATVVRYTRISFQTLTRDGERELEENNGEKKNKYRRYIETRILQTKCAQSSYLNTIKEKIIKTIVSVWSVLLQWSLVKHLRYVLKKLLWPMLV